MLIGAQNWLVNYVAPGEYEANAQKPSKSLCIGGWA
jgi:hypothetical protein